MASQNGIHYEKLKGMENYGTWQVTMQAVLELDDIWMNVVEVPLNAEGTPSTSVDEAKDRKARSRLTLSMEPNLYNHIQGAKTARDIWTRLKGLYEDKGIYRRVGLLRKLTNTKLIECNSMQDYVDRITTTAHQLREIKFDIPDEMEGALMLCGLPDEYKPMIVAMESSGMQITGNSIKLKLLQETLHSEDGAFFTNKRNQKKFNRRPFNRYPTETRYRNSNSREAQDCNLGYEEDEAEYSGNEAWCTVLSTIGSNKDSGWWFDSGATSHMTNDKSLLINFREANGKVAVANSAAIDIKGVGTATLHPVGYNSITVENVLYIPELSTNLLSVSKIAERGYTVCFRQSGCQVINKFDYVCADAVAVGSLFKLVEKSVNQGQSCNISSVVWHKRMGHLSPKNLDRLKNMTKGIEYVPSKSHTECEICPLGKATRLPFPEVGTRASDILDLVHSDICGPMEELSLGKSRYFLTFIDDRSRKVFVCILKTKAASEVLMHFVQFLNFVERQTGRKLKTLRTDNGMEYLNDDLQSELRKRGIEHQTTCTYTPEQNGMAERYNRTLVEMARCMMFEANVGKNFWAEALCYAAYLKNRSPHKGLDLTPEEIFTGKRPNLSHVRVFGTTAMVQIPKQKRKKLDAKAKRCMFVGYNTQTKGWRFFDLDKRIVFTSRNATFLYEGQKPTDDSPADLGSYQFYQFPISLSDSQIIPEVVEAESDGENLSDALEAENSIDSANDDQRVSKSSDALPKQPNSNPLPTPVLRRSERERNLPGKFKDFFLGYSGYSAGLFQSGNGASMDLQASSSSTSGCTDQSAPPLQSSQHDVLEASLMLKLSKEGCPLQGKYPELVNVFDLDTAHVSIDSSFDDPQDTEEALQRPDAQEWKSAMQVEFEALSYNRTWTLCDLPQGRKPIRCKWVFKTKRDLTGAIERYKARLVVKGYSQRKGIDYEETYAPVIRHGSLRYLFAVASHLNLDIHQMDVVTAFLQGDLNEEIYMEQPPYFEQSQHPRKVCRLNKALYGLKQSSRVWNEKLDNALKDFGLTQSPYDPCVYIRIDGDKILIVAVYVDDFLLFSNLESWMTEIKAFLNGQFQMKDLGKANHVLGMRITKTEIGISIDQSQYIDQILQRFNMSDCRPVNTPMNSSVQLSKADVPKTEEEHAEMKDIPYQQAVGCLLYLSTCTRPDISYAANKLARYCNNPGPSHWTAVKHLFRYLRGTSEMKLEYRRDASPEIIGYSDSDYASDIDDRKSITGFVFVASGGAISWNSKKQPVVALSSCEAEYVSLCSAMQEATWWLGIKSQLGFQQPLVIKCDNQSAISVAKNGGQHPRTKHIDVRYHFINNILQKSDITVEYIDTNSQPADIFTKPLEKMKIAQFRNSLGIGDSMNAA